MLLARLALAHGTGAAPSPCLAALLRDIERASLEAGPALRRIYPRAAATSCSRRSRRSASSRSGLRDVALGGGRVPPDRVRSRPRVGRGLALGARRARPAGRRRPCSTSTRASSCSTAAAIALTKLECDVLRYLREREGQPVARAALLRDVWGYEWTGGSNVVDVAVSGLRRKLGDRAGALETVRGVGYRLRRL